MPGTDTTLIPLIEAPIMPKATTHHGDDLPPWKKSDDELLRDEMKLTANITAK